MSAETEDCTFLTSILGVLDSGEKVNTYSLCSTIGELDHQKVVGVIKSLQSRNVVETKQVENTVLTLSEEGEWISENGSYEYILFQKIPSATGISQADLMKSVDNSKIGFSKALHNKWISVDKTNGNLVTRKIPSVEDYVKQYIQQIKSSEDVPENIIQDLKKRKLVKQTKRISYEVWRGDAFDKALVKLEATLTPEMLTSGLWKDAEYTQLNLDALGIPPPCGHLHPLLKVRSEFRNIFFKMGFSEMPTDKYVESSFWNFDALFQPQQHPARDAHDTFFLSDPATSDDFPEGFLERVKETHSNGGATGSEGYQYNWKRTEAQKNLLRTHTTSVSARMLYTMGERIRRGADFKPVKLFSIDRVFRNETLDATHLAEFHQVEGLVAEKGLTLGHLMGTIHAFFSKLGMDQIRFKAAYNPYTEPSMEIFAYHSGLKKWVEIGNSGMFRPEMLRPMGIPDDVNVIAWGLSLERPTMIKYGVRNIRELMGSKINLQMVYDSPLSRVTVSDSLVAQV